MDNNYGNMNDTNNTNSTNNTNNNTNNVNFTMSGNPYNPDESQKAAQTNNTSAESYSQSYNPYSQASAAGQPNANQSYANQPYSNQSYNSGTNNNAYGGASGSAHALPRLRIAKLHRDCRIMPKKNRNARPWTAGQGVMRHGRRIKAGFVKHKKPKGIIPTDS